MRKYFFCLFFTLISFASFSQTRNPQPIPEFTQGKFMDDYGISYKITDSLWTQYPNVVYRIIKWDREKQYIIAQNDINNPSEKGLYTRIDFTTLNNMEPYGWGFCLTQYKAISKEEAEATAAADRSNPKKGCNGYPFSRMKRTK